MARSFRTIVPLLLVLLGLLLPGSSSEPAVVPSGEDAVTVRTTYRKMHLVRPDLIPYPVGFEVYC